MLQVPGCKSFASVALSWKLTCLLGNSLATSTAVAHTRGSNFARLARRSGDPCRSFFTVVSFGTGASQFGLTCKTCRHTHSAQHTCIMTRHQGMLCTDHLLDSFMYYITEITVNTVSVEIPETCYNIKMHNMKHREVPANPLIPEGPWTLVPASPFSPGIPLLPAETEETNNQNQKLII